MQVDVTGVKQVYGLTTNGVACPYTNKVSNGKTLVLFSTPVTTAPETVVVTVATNSAPTLPSQTNRTIAELTQLRVTNTASDADGSTQTLSYTLLVAPAGASIDTNGVITWTPAGGVPASTNTFTTVVTDSGAPALSATNNFTVTTTAVWVAPSLPTQTNWTIGRYMSLTVTNTATDGNVPAGLLNVPIAGGTDQRGDQHERGDYLDAGSGAGAEHECFHDGGNEQLCLKRDQQFYRDGADGAGAAGADEPDD